jgi:hypothetical protein
MEAFLAARDCQNGDRCYPGWNKFWAGGILHGWWGDFVTEMPIRLAALEIAADRGLKDVLVSGLTDLYQISITQNEANSSATSVTDRRDCFTSFAKTHLVGRFAPGGGSKISPAGLALLRRLNLDTRDQPVIERWRWSASAGVAYLSDGGRCTVKPEAVWAAAVECSMDDGGRLPDNILEMLARTDQTTELLELDDSAPAKAMRSALSFYGLGRNWIGGIKLTLSPCDWLRKLAGCVAYR